MGRPGERTDWVMTVSSIWVLFACDACVQVEVSRLDQDRGVIRMEAVSGEWNCLRQGSKIRKEPWKHQRLW